MNRVWREFFPVDPPTRSPGVVDDTGRRLWRGQCTSDPEREDRIVEMSEEDANCLIPVGWILITEPRRDALS